MSLAGIQNRDATIENRVSILDSILDSILARIENRVSTYFWTVLYTEPFFIQKFTLIYVVIYSL